MSFKYIKYRQKKLEKKWRRQEELEAKEEAERVAKMEAEARVREEEAYRKRILLEQQESERLRQARALKEAAAAEQKWDNQCDVLLAQIKDRFQKDKKLEEIRFIVHSRDPSLQVLDWASWLSADPLNQRLADLDIEHAMEMFKRDNLMAARRGRTRGKKADKNYVLTFAGDTVDDFVETTFNPDNYDGTGTGLNHGFTVSFWIKPDEIGGFRQALGRRSENNGRFHFGIKSASNIHVGIGQSSAKDDNTHNDGVETGHGMEVGTWYNVVVTYGGDDHTDIGGDRNVRMWINGKAITKTGATGGGMGISNWQPSWTNTVNDASNVYFGARTDFNGLPDSPYSQGWACSLSEVAIYKTETDDDGTFANEVYDAGFGYDHRNNSNLVGYWRLNEGGGTTVKDLSGNGNHGTLTTEGTAIPTWTRNGSYE